MMQTCLVDEEVLGLEVAVQDAAAVAPRDALQQLRQVRLHVHREEITEQE